MTVNENGSFQIPVSRLTHPENLDVRGLIPNP